MKTRKDDENPLLSYLGDMDYKKPNLTLQIIIKKLSDVPDFFSKLSYLEDAFDKIKKNDKHITHYNEVRMHVSGKKAYDYETKEGLFTDSQMRDIWQLKLAYLYVIANKIIELKKEYTNDKEYNDQLENLQLSFANYYDDRDLLVSFGMGSWLPEPKLLIDPYYIFLNIMNGESDDINLAIQTINDLLILNLATRFELHWDVLNSMEKLGYRVNPKGLCHGVSSMYMQAILVGEVDVFEARLDRLFRIPAHELYMQIDTLKLKLDNNEKLNDNEIDLLAFFDGIQLYMSAHTHHSELFDQENYPRCQDENILKILSTSMFSHKREIESLSNPSTAWGHFEINEEGGYFFSSLQYLIDIHSLSNQPLCLMLGLFSKHTVSVGYDPHTKEWSYFDINCLPIKKTDDAKKIVEFVLQSRRYILNLNNTPSWEAMMDNRAFFVPKLFIPADMKHQFADALNDWMAFYSARQNFYPLSNILNSIPEVDRIEFLFSKIDLKMQLERINSKDSLESFLSCILKTLSDEQSALFIDRISKISNLISNIVTSYEALAYVTSELSTHQKKTFIKTFQLEKYSSNESIDEQKTSQPISKSIKISQSSHTIFTTQQEKVNNQDENILNNSKKNNDL